MKTPFDYPDQDTRAHVDTFSAVPRQSGTEEGTAKGQARTQPGDSPPVLRLSQERGPGPGAPWGCRMGWVRHGSLLRLSFLGG